MHVTVFIATSLDGFIARRDGSIDWLTDPANEIPGEDFGYQNMIESMDALFMGRNTFETVQGFGAWPYGSLPVIVFSQSLRELPTTVPDSVQLMSGPLEDVLAALTEKGYQRVYVDGGQLIQSMIRIQRINELIITRLPVLIGEGIPLFGPIHSNDHHWQHQSTQTFSNGFIQSRYVRLNE